MTPFDIGAATVILLWVLGGLLLAVIIFFTDDRPLDVADLLACCVFGAPILVCAVIHDVSKPMWPAITYAAKFVGRNVYKPVEGWMYLLGLKTPPDLRGDARRLLMILAQQIAKERRKFVDKKFCELLTAAGFPYTAEAHFVRKHLPDNTIHDVTSCSVFVAIKDGKWTEMPAYEAKYKEMLKNMLGNRFVEL